MKPVEGLANYEAMKSPAAPIHNQKHYIHICIYMYVCAYTPKNTHTCMHVLKHVNNIQN